MGIDTYFISQFCIEIPYDSDFLEDCYEKDLSREEGFIGESYSGSWIRLGPVLFLSSNQRWSDADGDLDNITNLTDIPQLTLDFFQNFLKKFPSPEGKYRDIMEKMLVEENWKLRTYIHYS